MKIDLNEIERIVDKGVRPKKSFIKYLSQAFKELGIKNIFHDLAELIVVILVSVIIIGFFGSSVESSNHGEIFKLVFILSPLIYISSSTFAFINSKEKGTFDLEMTCKYNLYQITAIRMFIFSIVATVINTVMIIIMFIANKELDIFRLICVSITSVFLYSTIFLFSLVNIKNRTLKVVTIGSWTFINIILAIMDSQVYSKILLNVPIYIHIIITLVCGFTYIRNLNRLINIRRKRGEI